MPKARAKLTPKAERFVREYLIDLNATQAAIRAGYSSKNADVTGPRMLGNVGVAAAIAVGMEKRRRRGEITQARVLQELRAIAFSNHTHFMQDEKTGRLVLADGAPKRAHAAVSSVKYKTTTGGLGEAAWITREVEFRLWNKPGPLELAGRHVGLFMEVKEAPPPSEIHVHVSTPAAPDEPPVVAQDSTLPKGAP